MDLHKAIVLLATHYMGHVSSHGDDGELTMCVRTVSRLLELTTGNDLELLLETRKFNRIMTDAVRHWCQRDPEELEREATEYDPVFMEALSGCIERWKPRPDIEPNRK